MATPGLALYALVQAEVQGLTLLRRIRLCMGGPAVERHNNKPAPYGTMGRGAASFRSPRSSAACGDKSHLPEVRIIGAVDRTTPLQKCGRIA